MRINTNIASLNAQTNATNTNLSLQSSLEKLSSGLKINKASDDASGMAIADKLRTQASSLGQGISNANSGSALIQIADAAMAEQSNILDTVKTKLIQASTSTTSAEGREAVRKDIAKLLEQMDNISSQTNYNGVNLLNEKGAEFSFQVGEDSSFDIGLTTAYSVNTAGLGSAGATGTTQATIKVTAAGIQIEGEVSDVNLTAKTTIGGIAISGAIQTTNTTNADASFEISADKVTGMSVISSAAGGDGVMLTTTDIDLMAALDKEANKNTTDGLVKLQSGTYSFKSTTGGTAQSFTFSNNVAIDISNLTVSGLSAGTIATASDQFSISTSESVSIHKTSGTADIAVEAATKAGAATAGKVEYTIDSDTAGGIDYNANFINITEGTTSVKSDAPAVAATSQIALNDAAGTKQEELSMTIAADDVKSISVSMSAGTSSVTLSSNDAATTSALDAKVGSGLSKNLDGTYTLSATSQNKTVTLDFGDDGIDISNLSFSGVLKTTAGGASNERIFIETSSSVSITNDSTSTEKNTGDFSVQTGNVNSAGTASVSTAAVGLSADTVSSGMAFENLEGLTSLGEGKLTAEMANNFMSVVDDAMSQLNTVRSDFGSTQNQLSVATRNMMTTQVNIKAAESIIRDVDYAAESAAFNKQNIIAQAGTYAMSQANAMQQNVLRLLQ